MADEFDENKFLEAAMLFQGSGGEVRFPKNSKLDLALSNQREELKKEREWQEKYVYQDPTVEELIEYLQRQDPQSKVNFSLSDSINGGVRNTYIPLYLHINDKEMFKLPLFTSKFGTTEQDNFYNPTATRLSFPAPNTDFVAYQKGRISLIERDKENRVVEELKIQLKNLERTELKCSKCKHIQSELVYGLRNHQVVHCDFCGEKIDTTKWKK